MTIRRVAAVIALASMLAVASCSSHTAGNPVATASPTPSTATVVQYASGMNGPIKAYQKAWSNFSGNCAVGAASSFGCFAEVTTLNLTAERIQLELEILNKPTATGYVGPPPATLVQLIATTTTDADTVITDAKDASHPDPDLMTSGNQLNGDCDAWGPYLHA